MTVSEISEVIMYGLRLNVGNKKLLVRVFYDKETNKATIEHVHNKNKFMWVVNGDDLDHIERFLPIIEKTLLKFVVNGEKMPDSPDNMNSDESDEENLMN